jgi:hypothetical protein
MTGEERARFEALGRAAWDAGRPAAPALDVDVRAAIAGMPVGGGAAAIMSAFSAGYEAGRELALAELEGPRAQPSN